MDCAEGWTGGGQPPRLAGRQRSAYRARDEKNLSEALRREVVSWCRRGFSQRSAARHFRVSLATVQWWLRRAGDRALSQVSWQSRSSRPESSPTATPKSTQRTLCRLRRELAKDALGFVGAQAVHAAFRSLYPQQSAPCVRTIHRVLHAHGFMDVQGRPRTPPPPTCWYLPPARNAAEEVDSFDLIEGLGLGEAGTFEVFTGRALWGAPRLAIPARYWDARTIVTALHTHWQDRGAPGFAQFDNDLRFHGARHPAGSIGRVIRFCLQAGVVPVFAPPRESGFQASIEHFNGLWQQKVWDRFHFRSLDELRQRSARFVEAYTEHLRSKGVDERAPRHPLAEIQIDYSTVPRGRVVFLRRTNAHGTVDILSHRIRADPHWPHRLLRCELDLPDQTLRCYRLRRRAPADQPLIGSFQLHCCLKPIRRGRTD